MSFFARKYKICYNEIMKNGKHFLYGILLGIANAIPGVSGSTIAVVLNIYDKILLALSRKNLKANGIFLLCLASGAGVGIYLTSQLMVELLYTQQGFLSFGFAGIILGSIPAIYRRARYEKVKTRNLFLGILALATMIAVAILADNTMTNQTLAELPKTEPSLYFWLFGCSILAMIAMILPGISGSLVMLILGAYTITMEAIATFQWDLLLPLALGILTGGYVGVKLIKRMLRNHPQALYFVILGLVMGSLATLYPGMEGTIHKPASYFILLFCGVITFFFGRTKKRVENNPL
jgi:putative membrane protein